MKTEQYPTWLVSPDIAKELKEIGFDKPCVYYTNEQLMASSKPYTYDSIKTHIYIRNGTLITDMGNHNIFKNRISVPVWDDVFEWFRERGLFSYIRPNMGAMDWYSYRIYNRFDIEKGKGMSFYYESARLFCMETLIERFKERQRNKEKRIMGSITI